MITKGGGYMEDNVVMRIICNETKAKDFLRRLSILCENNNFQYTEIQNEPYWKIEGRKEMLIEFGPVPVWNYGKWSEVYKYLFEQIQTLQLGIKNWNLSPFLSPFLHFLSYPSEYTDICS